MSKPLCCFAFESLYYKLGLESSLITLDKYKQVDQGDFKLPSKAPLFITWNYKGHLRGCIGTFQPQSLESGVKLFAYSAAFHDPRFPPIKKAEVQDLSVAVTLLDNFEQITDPSDWTIGKHGLRLNMHIDGDYYLGTFLPSVAEEQQWDKVTTLWYLLRKADYSGVSQSDTQTFFNNGIKKGYIELERYEGLKDALDNQSFLEYRKSIA